MICKKCSKIIVCHAFTFTNCNKCSTKITTGHIPGYTICRQCSESLNLCQQCGKEMTSEE